MIDANVVPHIGHHKLKKLDVEIHNALYAELAKNGRTKPDNTIMYRYWALRRDQRGGLGPTYREVAAACGTTEYAAKAALTRYRRGRVPQEQPPGLAIKTLRNIDSMLSLAWVDAIGHRYMTSDPTEYSRFPRMSRKDREGQKSKARPWTEEELGGFLAEAFKDRFGALWLLAASCGARRSELAGVNRLGLNLSENPSVDFHDTRVLVNGRAEDSDGKTDAGWRTASLDSLTVEHLTAYLKKLAKERESFGPSYPTDGYLFVWEDGTRIHPGTITKTFNRIVDRAGVPRIRLHDIRHTYVTMARNHGVNRKLLAERIGHKNQTVTDTIYAHPTPGADRSIAETMGAVIQKAVEQAG